MKNMKLALSSALFCLGAATLFTACGDDSSSSASDNGSKNGESSEVVSCHIFNTVDEEGTEINEFCVQATKGTTAADSVETACKQFKAFMGQTETDWSEIGTSCPDKKTVVTCQESETLTSFYYSLEEEQQALVVEGDDAKTCENLKEFDD